MAAGAPLTLRNAAGFIAVTSLFGLALFGVIEAMERLDIQGPLRVLVAFAVDAACGSLGYFLLTGDGRVRAWLVFAGVMTVGGLLALGYPGMAWAPLTALPFAGVAAGCTLGMEKKLQRRPLGNQP